MIVQSVLERLKDGVRDSGYGLGVDGGGRGRMSVEERSMNRLKTLLLVRFVTRGVEATPEFIVDEEDGEEPKEKEEEEMKEELGNELVVSPKMKLVGSLRSRLMEFVSKDLQAR